MRSLQAIGATGRDIVAILQAMKAAYALHADLEVFKLSEIPILTGILPTGAVDAAAKANAEQRKLEKAAQDFEGLLLSSLWRSMSEGLKSSLDDDSTNETYRDMGLQAVAGAMAASGGLGIGRMLLKILEAQKVTED